MSNHDAPTPVSRDEALRVWNLMKQNEPLSEEDQALVHQAAKNQMLAHHQIRPLSGKERSGTNTEISANTAGKEVLS